MVTISLKACKRCGGDMSYEVDVYGPFRQCLQCSHLEDLPSDAAVEASSKSQKTPESVPVAASRESMAKEARDAV